MKDIRQSQLFANFMESLGWRAEKIGSNFLYLRKFPLFGFFAKMPRASMPIDCKKILVFKKNHHAFKLKISPFVDMSNKNYQKYQKQFLDSGFKIDHFPFSPTTNFLIDLTKKENDIFSHFYEAKRRAVRRALKNKILVRTTDDINSFIKIRQRQYATVWFLVGGDMRKLWQTFFPSNAALLLAYEAKTNNPVAGILLLFYENRAYYWFASALPRGKKLFAPTLLVWEAIKLAKKRGCKIFDFEGIYDERFPKASASWRGFTRFKEGFGGKKVIYLENFKI